ncbi:hypothetical protein L2E82_16943 [Cichorium intybus]|uniref:Uncharacterized protein n=1 Tax=Cichorium intybus TaxID=13427 RepID=A0ACB9F696_CICIN|nr:hypothetical protein L2E82_16943 [Cichorium intybus]
MRSELPTGGGVANWRQAVDGHKHKKSKRHREALAKLHKRGYEEAVRLGVPSRPTQWVTVSGRRGACDCANRSRRNKWNATDLFGAGFTRLFWSMGPLSKACGMLLGDL